MTFIYYNYLEIDSPKGDGNVLNLYRSNFHAYNLEIDSPKGDGNFSDCLPVVFKMFI